MYFPLTDIDLYVQIHTKMQSASDGFWSGFSVRQGEQPNGCVPVGGLRQGERAPR